MPKARTRLIRKTKGNRQNERYVTRADECLGVQPRGSGNLAIALSTPLVNLVALAILSAMAYFALSGESSDLAATFAPAS